MGRAWSEIISSGYSYWGTTDGDSHQTTAFGLTTSTADYFESTGHGEYVDSNGYTENPIPIDVLLDVAYAFLDASREYITESKFPNTELNDYQLYALLSVKYNFGNISNDLVSAIESGDEDTIKNTWLNLGGSSVRREAEYNVWSEGAFFDAYNGGAQLVFNSSTPWDDFLSDGEYCWTWN